MQIGIDSFVPIKPEQPYDGPMASKRAQDILVEIALADEVGIDVFGIGEHHREEYLASAPAIFLAAAAARTKQIILTSAVTVLSSDDPVRVYQQFATVDLISGGRAEIQVGRGSFIESYPLFGYDLSNYDELFAEKLDLLLKVRDQINVEWKGLHRAALEGQGIYPRALQTQLPVRLGVGGTPASFIRAGKLGLPLTVAIIGGNPKRFRPMVDAYREEYKKSGHDPKGMSVAVHSHGYMAGSVTEAKDDLFPSYSQAMAQIGRERGWPPYTHEAFDSECGAGGSLYVGDPMTVAGKIHYLNDSLGGIDRLTLLMDPGCMGHEKLMRSIEILGKEVAPLVKQVAPTTA